MPKSALISPVCSLERVLSARERETEKGEWIVIYKQLHHGSWSWNITERASVVCQSPPQQQQQKTGQEKKVELDAVLLFKLHCIVMVIITISSNLSPLPDLTNATASSCSGPAGRWKREKDKRRGGVGRAMKVYVYGMHVRCVQKPWLVVCEMCASIHLNDEKRKEWRKNGNICNICLARFVSPLFVALTARSTKKVDGRARARPASEKNKTKKK